ncbi:MAG: hypothetical protein WBA22_13985 [Candidatus Methanofastidiosia archaeon]
MDILLTHTGWVWTSTSFCPDGQLLNRREYGIIPTATISPASLLFS